MTFQELLDEMKKIKCEEIRQQTENFMEIVIARANLKTLGDVLQSYFGLPLKPEGKPSFQEADNYARPYGGIQRGQTLYYHKNEKGPSYAFLWPWGNGALITVKIVQE